MINIEMDHRKKLATIAGLFYLAVVLSGIFHLMYVPSKLIDWNNAANTFSNITTHETLFRLGIIGGLVCYIAFLFLPIALYHLFSSVNKSHATVMLLLALVSVPISIYNMLNKFAVLTLISKADYLTGLGEHQLQTDVMLHLRYYSNGNQLASIFWGLWLFPLGLLVFRSGYFPKLLGVLLMIGCIGYLIDFTGAFLFPLYTKSIVTEYIRIPGSIAEISTCLYLLFLGLRQKPLASIRQFTIPNN